MKKAGWKKRITEACELAGTNREQFEAVIDTLAGIMEIRDEAQKQYKASGGHPVVEYTNKGGHTNLRKNPALAVIQEMNTQALSYWRDLGLTPSGFKKLDGSVKLQVEKDAFAELLSGIGI